MVQWLEIWANNGYIQSRFKKKIMAGRLEGKVAVITGGTSGIGEATAELFVKENCKVIIAGRSTDKGQAIDERLGENVCYVNADVKIERDIKPPLIARWKSLASWIFYLTTLVALPKVIWNR